MKIHNQSKIGFNGALKFPIQTESAWGFANKFLKDSSQILCKEMNVRFYEPEIEKAAVEDLQKLKIPFVHFDKSDMTAEEFNQFATFVKMG